MGDRVEQVGRLIHTYHLAFDQAEWVNTLGWPLADGARAELSAEELDRAYARSIEIRAAEGRRPPARPDRPGR